MPAFCRCHIGVPRGNGYLSLIARFDRGPTIWRVSYQGYIFQFFLVEGGFLRGCWDRW